MKGVFISKRMLVDILWGCISLRQCLCCQHQSNPKELASDQNILDLGKSTFKNIKKAVAIAEDCLNDDMLPSGTIWEDLYAHIKT